MFYKEVSFLTFYRESNVKHCKLTFYSKKTNPKITIPEVLVYKTQPEIVKSNWL